MMAPNVEIFFNKQNVYICETSDTELLCPTLYDKKIFDTHMYLLIWIKIFLNLYKKMVCPHMENGTCIWTHYFNVLGMT